MRMTNGQIIQQAKDICIDDQSVSYTGLTDSLTFIKREVNNTIADIFSLMKEYKLLPPPITVYTQEGTTYYPYPTGFMKAISFTTEIGALKPPLRIVQSQQEWDRLQSVPLTSTYPTHIFPRRDDFGVYPAPAGVYPISITGIYQPQNMTQDDQTSGAVAVVNGSSTVTITGGLGFSDSMIGQWFCLTDSTTLVPSGKWYRVLSVTDTTHLELSRTFSETSAQGQTFVIGQSPEIPEELHAFIAYRVGSVYWQTRRSDSVKAQELSNFFYTGDFNNIRRGGRITGGVISVLNDLQNKGRGNSNLIETGGATVDNYFSLVPWSTTLSDSS